MYVIPQVNEVSFQLVGSAPNFPFGTVDDIEEIGQMGLRHDIPVHVDACLGGFLLPFIDVSWEDSKWIAN